MNGCKYGHPASEIRLHMRTDIRYRNPHYMARQCLACQRMAMARRRAARAELVAQDKTQEAEQRLELWSRQASVPRDAALKLAVTHWRPSDYPSTWRGS